MELGQLPYETTRKVLVATASCCASALTIASASTQPIVRISRKQPFPEPPVVEVVLAETVESLETLLS